MGPSGKNMKQIQPYSATAGLGQPRREMALGGASRRSEQDAAAAEPREAGWRRKARRRWRLNPACKAHLGRGGRPATEQLGRRRLEKALPDGGVLNVLLHLLVLQSVRRRRIRRWGGVNRA